MNIENIIIDKNADFIAIVGPTAVGKSDLAIKLAQKYDGEVINGDAWQVYKNMDIGTAKITKEEQELVKHHLIDTIDYKEEYNVKLFQKQAREKINELKSRKKLPIIVGGTGLYIQAVAFDYKFEEVPGFMDLKLKNETKTLTELQEYVTNAKIDINNSEFHNHKRLAVVITKDMLNIKPENSGNKKYYQNFQIIGLTATRDVLYKRIDDRVLKMQEQGLIEEVKQFKANYQSQQAIGYKEIHEYLDGKVTKEEAILKIQKNTRNFSKRQYTWFTNKMELNWYELEGDVWQLHQN